MITIHHTELSPSLMKNTNYISQPKLKAFLPFTYFNAGSLLGANFYKSVNIPPYSLAFNEFKSHDYVKIFCAQR